MATPDNSPGPVYEDFRQLLALNGRVCRGPSLLRRLLECVAALLESRLALVVAAFLCVGLVGVSWWEIHQRGEPQSAEVTVQQPAAATSTSSELYAAPLPAPVEGYMVRVGSFRDPENAAKVAHALREQTSNVVTEELAGLFIVELGPFPLKSAAEDSARALGLDGRLSPQVVRQK